MALFASVGSASKFFPAKLYTFLIVLIESVWPYSVFKALILCAVLSVIWRMLGNSSLYILIICFLVFPACEICFFHSSIESVLLSLLTLFCTGSNSMGCGCCTIGGRVGSLIGVPER